MIIWFIVRWKFNLVYMKYTWTLLMSMHMHIYIIMICSTTGRVGTCHEYVNDSICNDFRGALRVSRNTCLILAVLERNPNDNKPNLKSWILFHRHPLNNDWLPLMTNSFYVHMLLHKSYSGQKFNGCQPWVLTARMYWLPIASFSYVRIKQIHKKNLCMLQNTGWSQPNAIIN